jgi:REP element-mobilizing transposase RayT
MPRKPRIEYENAFYHVMNRGRGRKMIFHDELYYQIFVNLLEDVHERFGCIIHCYCLMGNHYHLLLETPHANLSRIMRHINGVYTQAYNRLKNTDGSLFRGRYKSILVDKDAYIMQLSRYIHRNPIDMKQPLVSNLEDYKWSSYRAYIGKDKNLNWLNRQFIYDVLGHKQKYKAYKSFIDQGVDEETSDFYTGKQMPSIIGESGFKQFIFEKILSKEPIVSKSQTISENIKFKDIVIVIAKLYKLEKIDILQSRKGLKVENMPRKMAMYLCQQLTRKPQKEIAKYFNLKSAGSLSFTTHKIRVKVKEDKRFAKEINVIIDKVLKQVA